MKNNGEESTDVVEIDAIGVDEWEHEQHTPRAMDENLAALVKQSSAQSGPVRAPTLDDGWDAEPAIEVAKPRTTTNTVARPATPKTKTMAMPTVAPKRESTEPGIAKPTAAATFGFPDAVPKAAPRVETKAITSRGPIKARTATDAKIVVDAPMSQPPPGFVEVKPRAAMSPSKAPPMPVDFDPPTLQPDSEGSVSAVVAKPLPPALTKKPTPQSTAAVAVSKKPTPQPTPASREASQSPGGMAAVAGAVAKKPTPQPMATVAGAVAKKPTPQPMAAVAPQPMAAVAGAVAKKPTPQPMAAVAVSKKPTPQPMAAVAVSKKPTPQPMAAVAGAVARKPTPQPMPPVAMATPTTPRAPTPLPFAPMALPQWPPPPAGEFEDWDNPTSAATSVGNRVAPSRPLSSDFKPEDSVIIDLNAKPAPAEDKPRRPQSYPVLPVIQTSEQSPSTSGVFVMPTAANPNAEQVTVVGKGSAPEPAIAPISALAAADAAADQAERDAERLAERLWPERVSAPELPPPPVASASLASERASSPGTWNTPLPQRLPNEPIAAPAAPSWPSSAGLTYDRPSDAAIPAPLAHEPTAPLVAKRSVVAAMLPLLRHRGVIIGLAGAAVLAIVIAVASSSGSHETTQAPAVAKVETHESPTPEPAKHVTPTRAGAMPAPVKVAAVEPVTQPQPQAPPTPTTKATPAKKPFAMRRISRGKKPVVVDYDKKPESSPLDADQALAQARAAYAIGNQHLFAGEGGEAVIAYRRALATYPNYAAGYRGLGLAFAQLGNKASAVDAFKTYVKLAPSAKDVALIQKRIRNLSVR